MQERPYQVSLKAALKHMVTWYVSCMAILGSDPSSWAMLGTRGVPEAEYLILNGTDNGFKMNNKFFRIIGKIFVRHSHSSSLLDKS